MVEWRPVKGFEEDYLVSTEGEFKKRSTGDIIKQYTSRKGYLLVSLNGKVKQAHRLVALTYIENLNNKPQVNHINEVKDDNSVKNLEWVTEKENSSYGNRTYKMCVSQGKPVRGTCIKTGEVKEYEFAGQAIDEGFDKSHLSACARGVRKSHKGFVWEYI